MNNFGKQRICEINVEGANSVSKNMDDCGSQINNPGIVVVHSGQFARNSCLFTVSFGGGGEEGKSRKINSASVELCQFDPYPYCLSSSIPYNRLTFGIYQILYLTIIYYVTK